ncbi:MAG: hypothetical protein UV60_C0007G0004 [Parcubacteria group bacterium GW2011_GWA2_43_11]|nr:MAG: hypothetical protein UV60_C0007G0004 [Parcubacteria group bacterium GW2011_GWA2_43_11]
MTLVIVFFLATVAMIGFNVVYRHATYKYNKQGGGQQKPKILQVPSMIVNAVLALIAILSLVFTSVVTPSGGQIALMDRVYACSPIEDGRNVALEGECGRQAEIIMPGFHFSPFIRVVNHISFEDMVEIEDGTYATLTARDGIKLEEGQVAARPWLIGGQTFKNENGEEVTGDMLDASFFLTKGMGRKGPQTTVLTPGRYPVNTYLWEVDYSNSSNHRTSVPPGFVGVVKSAIDDAVVPAFMQNAGKKITCGEDVAIEKDLGQLRAVIVPVGCRGVWNKPLGAGEYFLNTKVYTVTQVDTRVQNWTYKGGYTRKTIDLKAEEDGSIKQEASQEVVDMDKDSAGDAIIVKVEGWTVYQELRIQARVQPTDAPLMVAAVGNLHEVEDRIITPQVRSVLRNVGGSRISVKNRAAYDEAESVVNALKARLELLKDPDTDVGQTDEQRANEVASLEKNISSYVMPDPNKEVTRPTQVLDFQNEREAIETLVAKNVGIIGQEAGIDIVSVTLGNTDLPPELLVARKVEQLSGQLRNAYVQKRTAQAQRQATEAAKARADQQGELVKAQIGVETSKLGIQQRENEGSAERRYMEEQAKGQEAQANVLGKDRVAMLRGLEMVISHPEFLTGLKLPNTMVFGSDGLEGPAAILGGTKLFGSSDIK